MEGELHEASRDLHMMKAESDKLRADNEKLDILVKSLKEEIVLLHCSINEKDSKIKQLEKYSLQMHDDVLERDHQLKMGIILRVLLCFRVINKPNFFNCKILFHKKVGKAGKFVYTDICYEKYFS